MYNCTIYIISCQVVPSYTPPSSALVSQDPNQQWGCNKNFSIGGQKENPFGIENDFSAGSTSENVVRIVRPARSRKKEDLSSRKQQEEEDLVQQQDCSSRRKTSAGSITNVAAGEGSPHSGGGSCRLEATIGSSERYKECGVTTLRPLTAGNVCRNVTKA